jgi:hypothetical protein
MWELQPLSTNRRTTEISLLIGENTSLTLSQIPHNFYGIIFPLSLFSSSLVMCKISLDALPIYRQASKQRTKGHQLVLQVAPNWCPTLLNLQHQFGAYHCWLCQQCSWLHIQEFYFPFIGVFKSFFNTTWHDFEGAWQCGSGCFLNNFLCGNTYQWFFLFFKNYFWHQHIKTIQNVQTILNFNKKKLKFFWNAVCTAFPNMFFIGLSLLIGSFFMIRYFECFISNVNILFTKTYMKIHLFFMSFILILFYPFMV